MKNSKLRSQPPDTKAATKHGVSKCMVLVIPTQGKQCDFWNSETRRLYELLRKFYTEVNSDKWWDYDGVYVIIIVMTQLLVGQHDQFMALQKGPPSHWWPLGLRPSGHQWLVGPFCRAINRSCCPPKSRHCYINVSFVNVIAKRAVYPWEILQQLNLLTKQLAE